MTKTPDEIKKGLECCGQVGRCMHGCPYYINNNVPACTLHKSRDALAYIQQLESRVPRWISVEERLPEEKEDVAAIIRYNENVWEYGVAFRMDESWRMNGAGRAVVTHWMPLPEPPKEEEK